MSWYQSVIVWFNQDRASIRALAARVTFLEQRIGKMATSQQVTDIIAGINTFEAEVVADVKVLLDKQTAQDQVIADLTAKVNAGQSLSAEDIAALAAGQASLVQATTDLHGKVNPTP